LYWLIVGLGNPGKRYELTRHNVGFLVLDRFAQKEGIAFKGEKEGVRTGKGMVVEERVILAKPLTYMNKSGVAVRNLIEGLGIPLDRLLVIHDDLDLPFGRIKIKKKGGHGGHKGVKSIIECLGRDNFLRLKIGIGKPEDREKTEEYVLSPFSNHQIPLLEDSIEKASEAIRAILLYGVDRAMNMYN